MCDMYVYALNSSRNANRKWTGDGATNLPTGQISNANETTTFRVVIMHTLYTYIYVIYPSTFGFKSDNFATVETNLPI